MYLLFGPDVHLPPRIPRAEPDAGYNKSDDERSNAHRAPPLERLRFGARRDDKVGARSVRVSQPSGQSAIRRALRPHDGALEIAHHAQLCGHMLSVGRHVLSHCCELVRMNRDLMLSSLDGRQLQGQGRNQRQCQDQRGLARAGYSTKKERRVSGIPERCRRSELRLADNDSRPGSQWPGKGIYTPPLQGVTNLESEKRMSWHSACPTAVTPRGLQRGQVYSGDLCIEVFDLGMTQRTPVPTLMHSRVKQSARALALSPEAALPLLYSAARALRSGVDHVYFE